MERKSDSTGSFIRVRGALKGMRPVWRWSLASSRATFASCVLTWVRARAWASAAWPAPRNRLAGPGCAFLRLPPANEGW
jgi:hypothetical protein